MVGIDPSMLRTKVPIQNERSSLIITLHRALFHLPKKFHIKWQFHITCIEVEGKYYYYHNHYYYYYYFLLSEHFVWSSIFVLIKPFPSNHQNLNFLTYCLRLLPQSFSYVETKVSLLKEFCFLCFLLLAVMRKQPT